MQTLHGISSVMAERYFRSGRPVLAACCHLAVDDKMKALQKLIKGNEIGLAYAVGKCLGVQTMDHVILQISRKCERLGLYKLAVNVLQSSRDPGSSTMGVAARFWGRKIIPNPAQHNGMMPDRVSYTQQFFKEISLRSPSAYLETARSHEEAGNIIEALKCYAGRFKILRFQIFIINYIDMFHP